MAIDADLSAGLIDEKEARRRRQTLEDEGGFFGAIVLQGLSFADAAHSYKILTVGDGLVTQVPALIVSTAAGLLVSKAGVAGAADKALLKRLSGHPKALGMSGAVMLFMALLPGIPIIPFLALGSGASALDRRR